MSKRKSTARTTQRRRALDVVFEADERDLLRPDDLEQLLNERQVVSTAQVPINQFGSDIVTAYAHHMIDVDTMIEASSEDWALSRMNAVDRSIVRLGSAELMYLNHERAPVISEWANIARTLSTDRSVGFVMGVLNRVADIHEDETRGESLGAAMGLDSTTRDADRRPEKQRFFVLTGPSGVGKGTVEAAVRAMYPDLWISTSVTTRSPRTGEVDGQHYFFVDDAKFDQMIANGDLLEWATVHGTHRYGTPKAAVRDALGAGKTVLLEIDLDGARQIRASEPEVYEIFLAPPTWDTLRDRLAGRGTESEDERERRLETAKVELAAESEFDEIVINDDIDRTAHEVARIMGLEKPAASGEN